MQKETKDISQEGLFGDEVINEIYDEIESSDVQATAEFLHRNSYDYQGEPNEHGYPTYSPKFNAVLKVGKEQKGFYVHYSIPKHVNKKTAVASFWSVIEENGKKRFVLHHFDFAKIMSPIIDYVVDRGHIPPPPREQ